MGSLFWRISDASSIKTFEIWNIAQVSVIRKQQVPAKYVKCDARKKICSAGWFPRAHPPHPHRPPPECHLTSVCVSLWASWSWLGYSCCHSGGLRGGCGSWPRCAGGWGGQRQGTIWCPGLNWRKGAGPHMAGFSQKRALHSARSSLFSLVQTLEDSARQTEKTKTEEK